MEAVHALQPALVLLTAGVASMLLMPRLGLSPIVGYLIAGMLMGEHGLHLIEHSNTVHLLAELGVVFLLFDIGLHFSTRHIWEARRDILGLGPLQMLFCTAGIGLALMLWTEVPVSVVLLIAAALALSSTAVATQTLADFGQQRAPIGITTTAVLIFQDICAIFLLILASTLSGDGDVSAWMSVGMAFAKAVVAFIAAMLLGNYVITPVFNFLANNQREGIFTATALLLVLAAAAITGAAGLSLTLGAFLAGMMISTTAYRHVVQTEIQPFRGLLLGFFFITVGMTLDAQSLAAHWLEILVALAALMLVKSVMAFTAARIMKQRMGFSIQLGAVLSQGSEFAFVILALPGVAMLMPDGTSSILITAVALSMAATGPFIKLSHLLAERFADKAWNARSGECVGLETGGATVVILAMNKTGRLLADILSELKIPYKAFDYNHDRFVKARIDGYPVAFGDLADLRLMETIEMADAKILAICEPRPEIAKEVGHTISQRYPQLKRYVAIANDTDSANYPTTDGIKIICRSLPKGIDLSGAILKALDVPPEAIDNWFKKKLKQELTEQPVPEPVTTPDLSSVR